MTLFAIFQESLRSLNRNVLRSALTALGIIIGVGAFIVMVAIASGAKASVEASIASLGSNVMMVFSGSTTSGGIRGGFGSASTLTVDDYKAIAQECPSVAAISPSVRSVVQTVYQDTNWSTALVGVSVDYPQIRNWPTASGSFFDQSDVDGAAKVCVLGKVVADQLFGGADPVGQIIRIKKIPFRVLGVLSEKGSSAMGSASQDDTIQAPYTTVQKKIVGNDYVNNMQASAVSGDRVTAAIDEITGLLRQRHHIPEKGDNDFSIVSQAEIASAAGETSRVMLLLLGSVAAVSLVVGGIGIMNIMLVSVTERTREIGIRMAVGAQGRDILLQFVMEAVTLSVVGGLAGALLGIGAAVGISSLVGWPVLVSPGSVLLSVGFAGVVGIVFGLYPAMKAAALDPIEALRYE